MSRQELVGGGSGGGGLSVLGLTSTSHLWRDDAFVSLHKAAPRDRVCCPGGQEEPQPRQRRPERRKIQGEAGCEAAGA